MPSQRVGVQAPAASHCMALPALPAEVLEHICRQLTAHDRVTFASCCQALLLALGAHSAAWAELRLDVRERRRGRRAGRAPLRSPHAHHEHVAQLAAWLAQRCNSLRSLELVLLTGPDAGRLLPALASATRLTALALHSTAASCHILHLPPLPALAELRLSCGRALDSLSLDIAVLALTPALTLLEVSTGMDGGLRGSTGQLPPSLQALRLEGRLPSQLGLWLMPVASGLRDLSLHGSSRQRLNLGADNLGAMVQLTSLALRHCELPGGLAPMLPLLRRVPTLASLDLRGSFRDGEDAAEALAGLAPAPASLTRLSLAHCRLHRLPPALKAMGGLRDLELGANGELGRRLDPADASADGPGRYSPLEAASLLSRLGLARCGLRSLPHELRALGVGLRQLDLRGNPLGDHQDSWQQGPGSLEPLAWLRGLTRIDLDCCRLRRLPRELQALPSLQLVYAAQNYLGDDAEDALPPSVQVLGLENQDDAGDPDFE